MQTHTGVYGFIHKNRRVLVIKKSRGPYTGMFDLPGGTPETQESLDQTLIREIQEELGVTPVTFKKAFQEFQQVDFHYIKQGTQETLRHKAMLYLVYEYKGIVKTTGDNEDCLEALWVDIGHLNPQNSTPFLRMMVNSSFF